ncbi:MAG TPA: NAD-dependent epimerase/dehydratase family protein [Solirubrobacteraceae bacterium]|nr:NAD-dependent epimerase/dehydratase family protein [Solirubrobacteraceae bacterium]
MRLAVTGITGTIGLALGDRLERDGSVERVVGLSRHPFEPAARGWTKIEHRVADVRDPDALRDAFDGAEVVIHLAFALHGVTEGPAALRAINVGGTRNAFEAAVEAGARRFVHASSAAAYGVRDLPVPITEDQPTRPDPEHFYSEHKAQAEALLAEAAKADGAPELTMLRPCGVAGPHAAAGAARAWPPAVRQLAKYAFGSGLRVPMLAPAVPMQFLHETDAAAAFQRAATAEATGTFNIGPDDVLDGPEVLRALGIVPLPAPAVARQAALTALASLPVPVPAWSWLHLVRVPYVLDISAARAELKWWPRYSSREALASTRAAWSA